MNTQSRRWKWFAGLYIASIAAFALMTLLAEAALRCFM